MTGQWVHGEEVRGFFDWPLCGDTVHLLDGSTVRCVLPEHHQMDGEAWHTNDTSVRWRNEDEPPTRVSHRYPDAEAVA